MIPDGHGGRGRLDGVFALLGLWFPLIDAGGFPPCVSFWAIKLSV